MTIPVSPAAQVVGGPAPAAWANSVKAQLDYLLAPSTFPIAVLRQTVPQNIPNNAYTGVLLDTEDYDTDGGHSTATNTSRYVGKTEGFYNVSGVTALAANATGQRLAAIGLNGAPLPGVAGGPVASAVTGLRVNVGHRVVFLNGSTDYLELMAFQDCGGTLSTVVAGPIASVLHISYLHP